MNGKIFPNTSTGMSKRELYAAMAMQALVPSDGTEPQVDWTARQAVLLADALIKALDA